MKFAAFAAAIALGSFPVVASADNHGQEADHSAHAQHADHADHSAHAEHADQGEAAAAAKFTLDTPIEQLAADSQAKAVLDKHMPGFEKHPYYEQAKVMSVKAIAPFSQGMITEEMMAAIAADLAAIK
jgi:hypothetical protein